MSALDVLKTAASVATGTLEGALPPRLVRFTLEYQDAPKVDEERRRIATLLESATFELTPLDADLPRFLVLQFPGVARTISTPTLYAMASELTRALDLVSCVPDIGATFVVDPDPEHPISESAAGDQILRITCLAADDASLAKVWAIENIRADVAWAKTKGAGILVAQPDTGIARHPELDATAFDLSKAKNILDNSNDVTDPLQSGLGNPGHGTATSSVVVSRTSGSISGAAPEATLVPIRCVESVILGIDGAPLARAIAHARRIGADVISMSLGGPFYHAAIGAALELAVADGVIVIAAAGNCVQPFVVYPASDQNVIALAGIDHDDQPWRGTSRGPKVDVAAPAENVFVARRTPGDNGIGTVAPSQGTSFATALTAGVAALWLAHFGRAAVRAEAARRGTNVHQLFRAALRASARPPKTGTWDKNRFGSGIVDAAALLALPLAAIPSVHPAAQIAADTGPEAEVAAVMTEAAARRHDGFDWKRHGAEAVYLATDAWRRTSKDFNMLVESSAKPRPSFELTETAPAYLRNVLARAATAPAVRPPAVGEPMRRQTVRILGSKGREGPESSARISVEAATANLRGSGMRDLQDLTESVFAKLDTEAVAGPDDGARAMRRSVLENAERVVRRLVDTAENTLDRNDKVTLEALVKIKDRPALRVVGGTVDPNDPLFGEWGGSLVATPELPQLTGAVGRIDADGDHIGTGFVIAAGIAMTNRHVLEAIAEEVQGAGAQAPRWVFSCNEPTIDFSETADGSRRFKITGIVAAGADPIHGRVAFSQLDMALLAVEATNAAGEPLPQPIPPIADRPDLSQKQELFTIGFPARPSTSAMVDPNIGEFSLEVSKRLGQIFGLNYGRKYLSPGRVEQAEDIAGDSRHWVFTHDATTLGGNSGSCVVRLLDVLGAAGLHFGGQTLTANYAHSLASVRASGALSALDGPEFDWR
jgi:serine protease